MRDTLAHIIGSEWAWLTYWKEPSPSPAFLDALWTREERLFDSAAFPDWASVQRKWSEVESEQSEFVNRLTNESLLRMLPVGETELSLSHLMQHLANHSTYHRGQLSLMIRQLEAEPVATDFAMYLLESSQKRAVGR